VTPTHLAEVGPFLPSERSLLVLVGGGYVLGDFVFAWLMGIGGLPIETIRRRRVGVVVGAACLAGWGVGHASDPSTYPWLGADPSFLDVGGWFGMGPIAAAAVLWLVVGQDWFGSNNIEEENSAVERVGRSFGLTLAGAYLTIWLGLGHVPLDGHDAVDAIRQVVP
jgi:hypothetical protein